MKQCKQYEENLVIYIMADILITMRKEVGLSFFNSLQATEALGFLVNDITGNPIAKQKSYESRFRIKMIKFELWIIDRLKFVFIKRVFYKFIKPFFSGISIIFKHLITIPFGGIITKLFPDFAEKIQEPRNK